MNKIKFYISVTCLFLLFRTISFSQDYFPLEVGNRWDYRDTWYAHGEYGSGNSSLIITHFTIINNKEYFVFTSQNSGYQFYYHIENDTLLGLTSDSVECIHHIFNQEIGSTYYSSCISDSQIFYNQGTEPYFFLPDTQQTHENTSGNYSITFSKKFGEVSNSFFFGSVYGSSHLLGCIISGVTYGQLVVSVSDENENINTYTLSQNYPNPFNPATTIKYQIPKSGFVTIKVYDVLGNEIATLLNEEKPAGKYEVEFSATGGGTILPSGIYFYKLQIGDPSASSGQGFVETKKMVLMK